MSNWAGLRAFSLTSASVNMTPLFDVAGAASELEAVAGEVPCRLMTRAVAVGSWRDSRGPGQWVNGFSM